MKINGELKAINGSGVVAQRNRGSRKQLSERVLVFSKLNSTHTKLLLMGALLFHGFLIHYKVISPSSTAKIIFMSVGVR